MDQEIDSAHLSRRWILVNGTGLLYGTPKEDVLAATALGELLAANQYGLITGGWHGVDYQTTKAFLEKLKSLAIDPNDRLIQVIADGYPQHFSEGHVVRVPAGPREWLESQKYADALVLIGGRGGTYYSWLGALHDGIPCFPFGGTSGDAAAMFRQTLDLWELIPIHGITRDQFSALGMRIQTADDAKSVAEIIVEQLLWHSLDAVDAIARDATNAISTLFVSYSRKDLDWVPRLRVLMRPMERRGLVTTWADADIEAGKPWEPQLLDRLHNARAALLLVTNNFLSSRYVREVEVPALIKRLSDSRFYLFWALLEPCKWELIPELAKIQAVGGTGLAISESRTSADEQVRLIQLVNTITDTLSESNPRKS